MHGAGRLIAGEPEGDHGAIIQARRWSSYVKTARGKPSVRLNSCSPLVGERCRTCVAPAARCGVTMRIRPSGNSASISVPGPSARLAHRFPVSMSQQEFPGERLTLP